VEVGPNNYSTFSAELSDGSACESSNQPTRGLHQFTITWAPLRDYAFPPFNLKFKSLTKVTIDQTDLILIAPVWQAQPWWPVLLRLLISQAVLLSNGPTLLTDPTDLNRTRPRLHLAVFHISTNVSKLRALQQTLPIYSSQLLVPPPRISGRQIDPLSSSISDILIFPTELFNEGLAYRSLNVLRSAISSTHPKIDDFFSGSASLRYWAP